MTGTVRLQVTWQGSIRDQMGTNSKIGRNNAIRTLLVPSMLGDFSPAMELPEHIPRPADIRDEFGGEGDLRSLGSVRPTPSHIL